MFAQALCKLSILCAALLLSSPVYAYCWQEAGQRYGIEPELLQAIGIVESNLNPAAKNSNKDGSYDLGLMQINSRNIPTLNKFNISEEKLVEHPCLSVMSGAWILAGMIRKKGYSWEAVGAYNAGLSPKNAHLRKRYIQRVWPQYQRLMAQRTATIR